MASSSISWDEMWIFRGSHKDAAHLAATFVGGNGGYFLRRFRSLDQKFPDEKTLEYFPLKEHFLELLCALAAAQIEALADDFAIGANDVL